MGQGNHNQPIEIPSVLMKRFLFFLTSVTSLVGSGCLPPVPVTQTKYVTNQVIRVDSAGVGVELKEQLVPTGDTRLCLGIDTTAYIIKRNANDIHASVRPRRITDTSYAKTIDRLPAHMDTTAIVLRVWAEAGEGTQVELPPDGGSGAIWKCFSARALRSETAYQSVRIQSSKPLLVEGVVWKINLR